MNQIMVNAVEFDALLKEVEYLKAENEKLEEQLRMPKVVFGYSKRKSGLLSVAIQNYE
jgi:predicted ATP-grasp superfamily ATP-dependent carboligase